MANSFFQFKQFIIQQDRCAMKVTTDACLFGAWAAERVRSRESGVGSILDIGTGTGLLSLMIVQKIKANIDAIEIDEAAFQQANENIAASVFAERINILHGDAKTFSFNKKYELIISNPPFYENELKATHSKKNIAHHNEGLLLSELLPIIKNNLAPDGIFYLLLPYKRNEEIKNLLFRHEFDVLQMILVRQSVNHDYFRIMLSGKLKKNEPVETLIDEISITDEKQQYTPQFTELLKDYYLNL
ncbi:MAG: methyltransferase [Chitinophagaceae bacterium]